MSVFTVFNFRAYLGPSKGNGTKCPPLRIFKVIRISHKATLVHADAGGSSNHFQHPGVLLCPAIVVTVCNTLPVCVYCGSTHPVTSDRC